MFRKVGKLILKEVNDIQKVLIKFRKPESELI